MLRYLSSATGFASKCLLAMAALLLLSTAFAVLSADAAAKPWCLGSCGPSGLVNGVWVCTTNCALRSCVCTYLWIIDPNTGQIIGLNCPCT